MFQPKQQSLRGDTLRYYLTSGCLHILCFVAYFYKLLSDTRDFILADKKVSKITFPKQLLNNQGTTKIYYI